MQWDSRRGYTGGALDIYPYGPAHLENSPRAEGQLDAPELGPLSLPGKANKQTSGFKENDSVNDVTIGPWVWPGD